MERKNIMLGMLGVFMALAALYVVFKPSAYRGMELNPPAPARPINLTDSNGLPFQLDSLRGRVSVVFFGYTHCPDECPATLAKLKLAMLDLGGQAQEVQVILITTNPARDSAQVLKDYVSVFNQAFLGLTGSPAEMETVWNAYGVVVEDGGETHSELLYIIDREGNLRLTLPPDLDSLDIAHDLKTLLDE